MDVRVGTDIISVARIESLESQHGDRFLRRWFTDEELTYCRSKARPSLHLAARMAAKEAVAKVLRAPWSGPVPWSHVEITLDASGAPSVRLSGEPLEIAQGLGLGSISVSLAHCDDFATATAVCLVPDALHDDSV